MKTAQACPGKEAQRGLFGRLFHQLVGINLFFFFFLLLSFLSFLYLDALTADPHFSAFYIEGPLCEGSRTGVRCECHLDSR